MWKDNSQIFIFFIEFPISGLGEPYKPRFGNVLQVLGRLWRMSDSVKNGVGLSHRG